MVSAVGLSGARLFAPHCDAKKTGSAGIDTTRNESARCQWYGTCMIRRTSENTTFNSERNEIKTQMRRNEQGRPVMTQRFDCTRTANMLRMNTAYIAVCTAERSIDPKPKKVRNEKTHSSAVSNSPPHTRQR